MGNWRNRLPRRIYRQRSPWTSSSYDSELPSEPLQDNVPPWEKKFCYMIGSVPWRKVVNTKKFMSCHTSVLNWDDSAVEETYQNAKKRFWSEMNGFHCEVPKPNPDSYIDEIDWNPDIDPELMKELDREFFAPADEGEGNGGLWRKNKKSRKSASAPSEDGSNTNQAEYVNPWEGNNNTQVNGVVPESKENGWGEWNDCIKVSKNVDDNDNPWEVKASPATGMVKTNSWGLHAWKSSDCVEMSWDNNGNPWERGNTSSVSWKDNGWGSSTDKDWDWNNTVYDNNAWVRNSGLVQVPQQNRAPADRGWRDYGGEVRCGGRQWGPYNNYINKNEFRSSGGRRGGASNENGYYRRREGFRHNFSGYQNSSFRVEENHQTGNPWTTRGNNRKRVSFE